MAMTEIIKEEPLIELTLNQIAELLIDPKNKGLKAIHKLS